MKYEIEKMRVKAKHAIIRKGLSWIAILRANSVSEMEDCWRMRIVLWSLSTKDSSMLK